MILPRILAAFTVVNFLSRNALGGFLIRNGLIFALSLFLVPVVDKEIASISYTALELVAVFIKEAALGILIGFVVNIPFVIVEAVGTVIDNQRGASVLSMTNILSSSEASPIGIIFLQGTTVIFLTSGAFGMFLQGFYQSYSIWGITKFWPHFSLGGVDFFVKQFSLILELTVLLAAPVIIAMFLAEFALALVNRFAPQLNVFFLAMSIKSALAFLILSLYFGTLIEHHNALFNNFGSLSQHVLELVR